MRIAASSALALVVLTAACGKGATSGPVTTSGSSGRDAGRASGATPAASVKVQAAWSWGDTPKGEAGLRMRDPDEPAPTGPALIATGTGRLVVATQDGCLEVLDAGTGAPAVPHHCEQAAALGLAVIGDVAVIARTKEIVGYALADLHEVWRHPTGFVQTNQPLARPAAVDGRFCVIATGPGTMVLDCVDPAGHQVGTWKVPPASRIAFGARRIGVIENDRSLPAAAPAPGVELPVRFFGVDGTVVHEARLAGAYGPTFEQAQPLFAVRGGGYRDGWTTRFVDPDGAEILTVAAPAMLRGGGAVGPDAVVTTEFESAGQKDQAVRIGRPSGALGWRTDLGGSGPWNPFVAAIGDVVMVCHFDRALALDPASGAIVRTYPISSEHHGVWKDRVVFLVESRETRSDSDFGDAGVHAIDAASHEVVLTDDLGRDVAGGQRASDPVFDGDMAYVIAGGRVHAYRITS